MTIENLTRPMVTIGAHLDRIAAARWTLGLLFGLGLVRGILALLAYAPAHGADSLAYFFYAERLYGADIPNLAQVVPPLYPILILVSYKWLASAYPLVIAQLLMSAALVPLYFDALRRIDGRLALLVALAVLFDFQTALLFNFVSTEPLYVFLLALSFNLAMRAAQGQSTYGINLAAGLSLGLLNLTRAVGRFLILPLILLHLWQTRSWRRTLVFGSGFVVSLLAYSLLTQALFQQSEGIDSSSYMITGIAAKNLNWLAPENGPATVEFLDLVDECATMPGNLYTCYEAIHGGNEGMLSLLVNVTLETVQHNLWPYALTVWGNLEDFLKMSGQQLRGDETPASVQCIDPDGRADALTLDDTYQSGWGWAFGARSYIDNNFEEFRESLRGMWTALCPPWPESAAVRQFVDWFNFRYRSLGRPQPMLWYGALWFLGLIVPWVRRRYLPLILIASAYLFNHALISAVIDNVQPRYTVVTNPFRALLLLTLIYLVLRLMYQLAQRIRPPDPA